MLASLWQFLTDNSLFLLAIYAFAWLIRTNITAQRKYEETVRDKRLETYEDILHPFITVLTTASGSDKEKAQSQQKALARIKSQKYRELAFKLTFIGSDKTVRAFNRLWWHFYALDENPELDAEIGLRRLGDLLLNIRRDLGSRSTSLDSMEMLAWMLTDYQLPRFWWIPGRKYFWWMSD
ncbi:MAG: hypothetical protein F4X16_12470 [Caldilineaceae bacterium SB0661_bin_34]|nr:hypothetical protein [Caldilineaceae bacterium SB0661_bin_34]